MQGGGGVSKRGVVCTGSAADAAICVPASHPFSSHLTPPHPRPSRSYNLSRIFFGGFFIRGHPYTMETISFAIRFWSKVRAMFRMGWVVCQHSCLQTNPACYAAGLPFSIPASLPPSTLTCPLTHIHPSFPPCRARWLPCSCGMRASWGRWVPS